MVCYDAEGTIMTSTDLVHWTQATVHWTNYFIWPASNSAQFFRRPAVPQPLL
jgi:hypothetical protein